MSYRSKRTKAIGDQAMQSNISASGTLPKSTSKKPRSLPSNLDPEIRPAQGVCPTTSKERMLFKNPPMEQRSQLTKESHKFTFPPHLDPSFVRLSQKAKPPISANANMEKISQPREMPEILHQPSQTGGLSQKSKPPVSANANMEKRSQPREMPQIVRQPSQARGLSQKTKPLVSGNVNIEKRSQPRETPQIRPDPSQIKASPGLHATATQDIDPVMQDNVAAAQEIDPLMQDDVAESEESGESDGEPLQQGNEQDNLKKSKPSYARTMKSRSVTPNWPNSFNIDDKEDVLTIDSEKTYKILSGSIQPRDIDNLESGVKCIVHFNEFFQPIRKGGDVLVKYLGSLAKTEKFCPIGAETWHDVNAIYKADIVSRVREKFVIPNENRETFDRAILKRVGKFWRNHKHTLKKERFLTDKRTKEQIINDVPPGITKDNWMRLVEYWCSKKSQKRSSCGKEARASQNHVHTTGSVSYANRRADYVQSNGRQPSHLEFFQLTHTKVGGGFVENTLSSQLVEEANSKVDELLLTSSPSKTRAEIENDVFDKLMYENEHPKRPIGFGFGVKQSQVFGVHGILRKQGYGSATASNNSAEMELMKAKMLDMEKENEELRSKVDQSNAMVNQSNARVDQSNQILLQALNALRSGKVTDEFFEAAQLALCVPNSEVGSAASGNSARNNGSGDIPSSSQPN